MKAGSKEGIEHVNLRRIMDKLNKNSNTNADQIAEEASRREEELGRGEVGGNFLGPSTCKCAK